MNCIGASLLALITCLGNPDPAIRDGLALEKLTAAMRGGTLAGKELADAKAQLLTQLAAPDPTGFQRPFVILVLAEVARTDRVKPWMTEAERDQLVTAAADYLAKLADYRAFNDKDGYRHGVAHGADFAMQLALNPGTTKAQLDRLLSAIAVQVAPADPAIAYWAGEPDRLARPVLFIAQRNLHSEDEWRTWFAAAMDPKPLKAWSTAFSSEAGIRKRHNARAFLLSAFATAGTSEDPGIRKLVNPLRESLKLVP